MATSQQQELDCPLCGRVQFKRLFEKKGREFWRCGDCKIELQHPLPTQDELKAYYDASYADGMYLDFTSATLMKEMTARQRLREMRSRVEVTGRWLDVGCANGVLVGELAGEQVDAEGVELSDVAVQSAHDAGLNVSCGLLSDLPREPAYDGITAFDVLEHVLSPTAFLDDVFARLKPGGHAVFTLPNTGGIVRRLMGKRWYFYIPEEHLHYFSRSNLRSLFAARGFESIDIGATYKPMTYDYALTQFAEYNPLIFRVLSITGRVVPRGLKRWVVPLPIGELRLIGRKPLEVTADERERVEQVTQ